MIIPDGVNSRCKGPNMPVLEKIMYKIKPSATVGIPIRAMNILLTTRLPLNSRMLRPNAIGILQSIDNKVADPDTKSDLNVMSSSPDI